MDTKRFMILTHGSSAFLGVVALAILAWGSASRAASEQIAGLSLVAAMFVAVIGALVLIGRSYARLIGGLRTGSGQLRDAAAVAQSAATLRAKAASEQSASIAETSTAIEELAAVASSIADNSRGVSSAAQQTVQMMQLMQETVETIARRSRALGEGSQRIAEILVLINELSGKTNLLALNAAIEAARAGESGKGFAVVATEVRKLAGRSLESTDSIREIVQAIQRETTATVLATDQSTRQVQEVGELMNNTAELIEASIAATGQQQSAAEQVVGAVAQIRAAANQVAEDRERHLAAANEMSANADELVTILATLGAGPDHHSGVVGNFARRSIRETGTPLLLIGGAAAILGLHPGGGLPLAAGIALGVAGSAFFVWIRYYRVHKLLLALARIRAGLVRLSALVAESDSAAGAASAAASEQSAAVAETATTIEELAATATAIAESSRGVSSAAQQTVQMMQQMQDTVESIATRSRDLGSSSQQIDQIVALINEISGHTNLLALNAAIEAARAGDTGTGFAVVAVEVRKLAERSLESSDAIREIVGAIQQETDATIHGAEEGTREVLAVAELMSQTVEMLDQSILATRQQQSAAAQVAAAIAQIRASSAQLAADAGNAEGSAVERAVTTLEGALDGMIGARSGRHRRRAPLTRAPSLSS